MNRGQKHHLTALSEPVAGMPPAIPVNAEFMSAMIQFGRSYGEGMSLLSKEVLDFSSKRLSKNTATALSLCNCKEWGEAGRIQQDWMRTATQDYVAETGRLVNLALKTMADSCRPFEQQDEAAMRTTSANK